MFVQIAFLIIGLIGLIAVIPVVASGVRWLRARKRRVRLARSKQPEPQQVAKPSVKPVPETEAEIMARLMTPITPRVRANPAPVQRHVPEVATPPRTQPRRASSLQTSVASLIVRGQELQDNFVMRTRTPSLLPALMTGGPYAMLGVEIEAWSRDIDELIQTHGLPTRLRTSLRFRRRHMLGFSSLGAVSSGELADQLDVNLRVLRAISARVGDASLSDTSEAAV
jgi:hypothetical protein